MKRVVRFRTYCLWVYIGLALLFMAALAKLSPQSYSMPDAALVNVAFGIATVVGIFFAGAVTVTAIVVGRTHQESREYIGNIRSSLHSLIQLARQLDNYPIDVDKSRKLHFVKWLAERRLRPRDHDLTDVEEFWQATSGVYGPVVHFLNNESDSDRTGPEYEELRDFLTAILELKDAMEALRQNAQMERKVSRSITVVFVGAAFVGIVAMAVGAMAQVDFGSTFFAADGWNIVTVFALMISGMLIVWLAARHAEVAGFGRIQPPNKKGTMNR